MVKIFALLFWLLCASSAFAQVTTGLLDQDPVYGTIGFKRTNWISSLNKTAVYLTPDLQHPGIRTLNAVASPGSQWSSVWPDVLGIQPRDNEASFYVPARNELWIWEGAYLETWSGGAYWGGRFSFASNTWVARGNLAVAPGDSASAFTGIVDMTANGGKMPWVGLDPAMAWAANSNMGLIIAGSGDDGTKTFLIEPKAGGPEPYKVTVLSTPTTPRPPLRNQCMNCLVTDGTNFYLTSGCADTIPNCGVLGVPNANRRDLWKFTVATRTWTRLEDAPDASYGPMVTYDLDRNSIVSWVKTRLYEYSVASGHWSDITPAGFTCRTNATASYDPIAKKHIYMGGNSNHATTVDDVCYSGGTQQEVVYVQLTASGPPLPPGCEAESNLFGRSDILRCEPYEVTNWWSPTGGGPNAANWKGSVGDANSTIPANWNGTRVYNYGIADFNQTGAGHTVVSSGCISGNCSRNLMAAWNNPCVAAHTCEFQAANLIIPGVGGCSHTTVGCVPQQEVYARYYMKLSPNWSPLNYDPATGQLEDGITGGGKFPGLADGMDGGTSNIQCGNGSEGPTNGTECWSMRTTYQSCTGIAQQNGPSANACADAGNGTSNTRFGFYPYIYDGTQNGTASTVVFWDDDGRGGADGPCNINGLDAVGLGGGKYGVSQVTPYCGSGNAGIPVNQWLLIEIHIKMNTPGVANGVLEGWIDGVRRYQKTNVTFRQPGHNNIGIRTFWMNIYHGGTYYGLGQDMYVYIDQVVVANGARVGAFAGPIITPPTNVNLSSRRRSM